MRSTVYRPVHSIYYRPLSTVRNLPFCPQSIFHSLPSVIYRAVNSPPSGLPSTVYCPVNNLQFIIYRFVHRPAFGLQSTILNLLDDQQSTVRSTVYRSQSTDRNLPFCPQSTVRSVHRPYSTVRSIVYHL